MPYTEPKPGDTVLFVEEDGKTTYPATVVERTKDPVSGDVTPEGRVNLTFFDPDWLPDMTLPGHNPHTVTDKIATANHPFDSTQPINYPNDYAGRDENTGQIIQDAQYPHDPSLPINYPEPGKTMYDPSKPPHEVENWPAKIETIQRQVTPDIKPGRVTKAEGVPYEGFLPRDVTTRCWRYPTSEESAAAADKNAKPAKASG